MSANDRSNGRLAPRVVRVRNHCLAVLSARNSLPPPTPDELAALGDAIGLGDAWTRWRNTRAPSTAVNAIASSGSARVRSRWRSSRLVKGGAITFAGVLGFLVGERWLPRAGAQASEAPTEQAWTSVSDSMPGTLDPKIVRGATASALKLSAPEVAILVLRSPRFARLPIAHVEARCDSLLWIQGRLRGSSTFEFAGELRVVRRGIAELRVVRSLIDGRDVEPRLFSDMIAGPRARNVDSDRVRFGVPRFVASLRIVNGAVDVAVNDRAQGADGRLPNR